MSDSASLIQDISGARRERGVELNSSCEGFPGNQAEFQNPPQAPTGSECR